MYIWNHHIQWWNGEWKFSLWDQGKDQKVYYYHFYSTFLLAALPATSLVGIPASLLRYEKDIIYKRMEKEKIKLLFSLMIWLKMYKILKKKLD